MRLPSRRHDGSGAGQDQQDRPECDTGDQSEPKKQMRFPKSFHRVAHNSCIGSLRHLMIDPIFADQSPAGTSAVLLQPGTPSRYHRTLSPAIPHN
jgi:hypothetical protein